MSKTQLQRACLDPQITRHVIKLLIRQADAAQSLTTEDRVLLILSAIRCGNSTATQELIQSDLYEILSWEDSTRAQNSLLHLACQSYGWNHGISLVLDAVRTDWSCSEAYQTSHHLFGKNSNGHMAIEIALEAGADMSEILEHLRANHLQYFEANLHHLPRKIAQYCDDVSVLEDLVTAYPKMVEMTDAENNFSPLHSACYYQNASMIRFLLGCFASRGERQRKLQSRLSAVKETDEISPLGHLLIGLGSMDPNNAKLCLQVCLDIAGDLPLLHYTIDKLWNPLVERKKCKRTLARIEEYFELNLSATDRGKSVLVLAIEKLSTIRTRSSNDRAEARAVLNHILTNAPDLISRLNRKRRLPLHLACEHCISWHDGLEHIVRANVSALHVPHPKSDLLPFAVLACSENINDLDSIYQILRFNPGVM